MTREDMKIVKLRESINYCNFRINCIDDYIKKLISQKNIYELCIKQKNQKINNLLKNKEEIEVLNE